jgi:hypothetical protein
VDSHKDVLADPNSHASPDNDVHDLLGLPPDRMHYQEPSPTQTPAQAPTSAAKPLFPSPSSEKPAASPAPTTAKPERKYN